MVVFFEKGLEGSDESLAAGVDGLAVLDELGIPKGHHGGIPLAVVPHLLEEAVALVEGFVVGDEVVEVVVVDLRDDTVGEAAAELAAAGDELLVVGRDHDQGQLADVLGEGFIQFLVPAHLLGLPLTEGAADDVGAAMAVDSEEVGAEAYVLAVGGVEIAFAEGEVVDGIEEVGLASAVVADEAVDVAAEPDVGLGVILEVGEYQPVQYHKL